MGIKVPHKKTFVAQVSFVALAFVMCLRAVLPVGFMLDRDPVSGSLAFVICPGQSFNRMPAFNAQVSTDPSAQHYHQKDDHRDKRQTACAFEAIAKSIVQTSLIRLPQLLLAAPGDYQIPAHTRPDLLNVRPPLPPRGPPSLV